MKRTIIYMLLACLTMTSCEEVTRLLIKQKDKAEANVDYNKYTKEDSTHMTFKGVPINGPLKMFVKRMEKKGFEYYASSDDPDVSLLNDNDTARNDRAILYGDFADYKDCKLYVQTLDTKDVVSKIYVRFPKRDEWKDLHGDYKHLKEMLTTKYGKASACTEKMHIDPLYVIGRIEDRDRMTAVRENHCNYVTTYTTDKGDVKLSIESGKYGECFVMLTYSDKINSDIVRKQAIDDL